MKHVTPSLEKFLTAARAELNHIYTERPMVRSEGMDAGWFCREHAMHSYFLLRLFGDQHPAIEVGHYAVQFDGNGFTSHDSGSDHAWCTAASKSPIDLSISFRFHEGYPQLTKPVIGEGLNQPYKIVCFRDEVEFSTAMDAPAAAPAILYLPLTEVLDPDGLLEHPDSFLFDSGPECWLRKYGAEAFARVTLHVFKVAMSRTKSLTDLSPLKAFSQIRSGYSAARLEIRKLLASAGSNTNRPQA